LVISNSLPITLSQDVTWAVAGVAVIVSITCLIAGLLSVTRDSED
jgi:hypothetical protein